MNPGYLGSLIVHGVLIVMGIAAASFALPETQPEPVTTSGGVVLDLNPPGGGVPGSAVSPGSRKPATWTRVTKTDSDQILNAWRKNRESEAPVADTPVSATPIRRAAPVVAPGSVPPGVRKPLVAVRVGGPGAGGDNPVPGVSGSDSGTSSRFTDSVRAGFAATFIPLFQERGGDIARDKDFGEVNLRVSPAGNVTFGGWIRPPADALMAKIVLRSIEAMRPVTPPPGGGEATVRLGVSGTVE